MSHLGETKRRILDTVLYSENGIDAYRIAKELEKSYLLVRTHLKGLEKKNLVKLKEEKPSTRGGSLKKVYVITENGINLLGYDEEKITKEIIRQYRIAESLKLDIDKIKKSVDME